MKARNRRHYLNLPCSSFRCRSTLRRLGNSAACKDCLSIRTNHVLTFLKYAVPLVGGAEKIINPDLIKTFQDQIDLLEKILDDLPGLDAIDSISSVTRHTRIVEEQQAVGPALRAL